MSSNQSNIMDVASVLVAFGTVGEILPPIAAFLAIIWTGIRIYEWLEARFFVKIDATVEVVKEERTDG